MRIAIEGPELTDIDFEEILNIFKLQNRRIRLWISLTTYMNLLTWFPYNYIVNSDFYISIFNFVFCMF